MAVEGCWRSQKMLLKLAALPGAQLEESFQDNAPHPAHPCPRPIWMQSREEACLKLACVSPLTPLKLTATAAGGSRGPPLVL